MGLLSRLAGRDTTSQLLTWTLYLLSHNPEKLEKVLDEIRSTLNGDSPNYENTKGLKYLKAVLDETLRSLFLFPNLCRLWPPVPIERKVAVEDDTLPNGMFIPKGVRTT